MRRGFLARTRSRGVKGEVELEGGEDGEGEKGNGRGGGSVQEDVKCEFELPNILQLKAKQVARFGTEGENYWDEVFDIVSNDDDSTVAVSVSTDEIKLYSPSTEQELGTVNGHQNTITGLKFPYPEKRQILFSSSADGTIRVWDLRNRNGKEVAIFRGQDAFIEIWSFDAGGPVDNLVVGGGLGHVLFWDWRTKCLEACLEDVHKEHVTQVHFHPIKKDRLLTASTDGLINILHTSSLYDAGVERHVLEVGTSVQYLGFFGKDYNQIWCTTHDEKLSLWSLTAKLASEDGRLMDFGHKTRVMASLAWDLPQVKDLITCYYSARADCLWLVGSNKAGSVGFFPVQLVRGPSGVAKYDIGSADAILDCAHVQPIRCIWCPQKENVIQKALFWTGARDGKLCSWSLRESADRGPAWMSRGLLRNPAVARSRHSPC